MSNLLFHESVRQSVGAANYALKARNRGRRTLLVIRFGLCAVAGVAAAGLSVDTVAGAYSMIGAGLVAAVFLVVGYLTERRLRAIETSLCDSLDAIAVARAMANENNAHTTEQEALAKQFREMDAARLRDIFGRSTTILYR